MIFEWVAAEAFEGLSPIAQVYGVCFDEHNRVMVIRQPGDAWNLAGGKPELGETPEQTLRREVLEETNVTLGECGMIGYQKVTKDDGTVKYQLRYACRIARVDKVQVDPATGVTHDRLFLPAEKVTEYIEYPQIVSIVAVARGWVHSR